MASPPEGQKVVEGEYRKACPDYKRYSMFMQHVALSSLKTTTNDYPVARSQKAICNCLSNGPLSTVEHSHRRL
jgi:hypothetical protein